MQVMEVTHSVACRARHDGRSCPLRLAYLTVTTTFSFLGLLPRTDRDKEIEILVSRHQLMVTQRQVTTPAFTPTDRFLLAGLLHRLPTKRLRHLGLLVRPDTVLRWHRGLLRCRRAAAGAPRGRGVGDPQSARH
ncbi:hypothetical protein AB0C33_36045 [Nonomuraea sp. NPDC048881]|uniref:hypothetical protein n=1 Tax=unclassified Nonomuraea TaxID=2593643 RepID=UPI0033D64AED